MKRREDHAITKHTMNLYSGDYSKLQALYGTRVGAAKVIRDLVRAHIRRIEEGAAQKIAITPDITLDLVEETINE